MNYKNKSGFTLVELLAVIVILAVVILIAVTAVIPRMNKAKKKAFLDESLIYLNSINDAAITNYESECFDISNLNDYVKQSKDNYTGTLYVSDDGTKSINITDGKYYLVANNSIPVENDISEAKPSNFIDSCSDTSKTYTITYDLDGGTLASANPSSYTPNTDTIILNNPTKSGYEFVGWSSKNEFDETKYYNMEDYIYSANYTYSPIKLKPNTTYKVSLIRKNNFTGKDHGYLLISTLNQGNLNVSNMWTPVAHRTNPSFSGPASYTTGDDGYIYIGRSAVGQNDLDEIWANTNVQIEQGTTATDYQEYMEPTKEAKVYRGSTGNKKFIANYTNIFKITLDAQGATSVGTEYAYYQYNTTSTINGTICYYYVDEELTTCVANSYYITRPAKTGYTFKGYYTEPNGAGTQYVTASGGFTNNIYRTLGDRTLYAYWVAS